MKFDLENFKNFLSEIKPVDWIIFAGIVIALSVGILTMFHFRGTADKQIEANATIGFQVFLRGVTLTSEVSPINPNDKTFITIRNVPYTDLKVLDVRVEPRKTLVPNMKGGKDVATMVDDVSQAFLYDMIVTLVDESAKITKDGAVVGGNKIKIGLPVTLEGPSYRLNGTVSDVRILQPQPQGIQGTYGQAQPQQENGQAQPDVNKHEQNMG